MNTNAANTADLTDTEFLAYIRDTQQYRNAEAVGETYPDVSLWVTYKGRNGHTYSTTTSGRDLAGLVLKHMFTGRRITNVRAINY